MTTPPPDFSYPVVDVPQTSPHDVHGPLVYRLGHDGVVSVECADRCVEAECFEVHLDESDLLALLSALRVGV